MDVKSVNDEDEEKVFEDPNDIFDFDNKRVNQNEMTVVPNSDNEDMFGPHTSHAMITKKKMAEEKATQKGEEVENLNFGMEKIEEMIFKTEDYVRSQEG